MFRRNARHFVSYLLIVFEILVLTAVIAWRDKVKVPVVALVPPAHGVVAAPWQSTPASSSSHDTAVGGDDLSGIASWYGAHWQGHKTASGKRFDTRKLTAAHRNLPLNTRVRVTNLENGRSVIVLINDRGPYVDGRVIDLSTAAARHIGIVKKGVAPVQIDIVGKPSPSIEVASRNFRPINPTP